MANDMTPVAVAEMVALARPEARRRAVQEGAMTLLDEARRLGRFVSSLDEAAAARDMIAKAKAALAARAATAAEAFARQIGDLRMIEIEAGPIDEMTSDAMRSIAEVQLEHDTDYQTAFREYREARLRRRAYEKENEKAALFRGVSHRALITASVVGTFEIPAGAYLLWQTSSFPGGPIGGAIAATVMFLWNIKLGRVAGVLGGRSRRTARRRIAAIIGAIGVAGLAGLGNLVLGCLRADLPLSLGSILTLMADPVQHLSAWVLITMECSVYVGAFGWALGRERAGDNAEYRRICAQEAQKKGVFVATRQRFIDALDEESDTHRAAVSEAEKAAKDGWSDAREIYGAVHGERRALAEDYDRVVRTCAALLRDMWTLAASDYHGPQTPVTPDFEQEVARLIPPPTTGSGEVPLARRVFKEIRETYRSVVGLARSSRGSIADTRLAALRPIYAIS